MKSCIKNPLLLTLLVAGLGLMMAGQIKAQTFTTLHHFSDSPDGTHPYGGLVSSGSTLYGTAYTGGTNHSGMIFAVNTNGTGYTNLHNFSYSSDGASPYAGLVLSGGILYGTALIGGSEGNGTLFAMQTNGANFTRLHTFTGAGTDGANPYGQLILSGNTLYGTTDKGGSATNGMVFAVSTNGTGFVNLHSFDGTNKASPRAGLILSGSTLYGTVGGDSSLASGTVFAVGTNGTGFTNRHVFTAVVSPDFTNSDGANPYGALILAGTTLYGTTYAGGSAGNGTVFAMNSDGTGFTNLHSFAAGTPIDTNEDGIVFANSEGISPNAGLVLVGNTLYGTAVTGGSAAEGTLFAVRTDGTGFTNLHNFTEEFSGTNSDGANPNSDLILAGNSLYGTANHGGALGFGTVFAFSLPVPPSIKIVKTGNNIILSWPTNAALFTLQTITNLSAVNWSNVTSGITIVGTNYYLTNPVTGKASFFRLKQ